MSELLNTEILNLITLRQLVVILHLVGLAFGAGGALVSELMFIEIMEDKKISTQELTTLKTLSKAVWIGLMLLLASGVILFFGNPEGYLNNPKFLAKMTIVLILTVNGAVFHFWQIPKLKKFINKNLAKSQEFKDKLAKSFFAGGAVSGVSWVSALVLGSISFIELSYVTIMAIYVAVVALAIGASRIIQRRIIGT